MWSYGEKGGVDLSITCSKWLLCLGISYQLAVFYHYAFSFFHRNVIKEGLLQIVKFVINGKSKDPSWLFLTPLIHFLSDDCKPFEFPLSANEHQSTPPTWWGTSKITDLVESFKRKDSSLTMWVWYIFTLVIPPQM